ncbi:MAG: phenazine biosynthesis protein [Microbacterium sp.]|uniref:pyridoxine/pyridoxamine 5'-phosphate oxidase n=1 Tax=Microbacterium aquimaris TaxID=459816 RepID=UPI000C8B474E|nr:pyridoxamine 5'-phosphate oxidase family protein [Microbacterium aquimaris]MAP62517.1 phenazine biosynthesis protein [Microbacterium sp.]MDZ8276948.1 pyridoxamine 5'-phosphate oxidase family protein [Microbacterium aquimaris]
MANSGPVATVVFPRGSDVVARLDHRAVPQNPLDLFDTWSAHARDHGEGEATYVTLATSSPDGAPSSRTVQLLAVEEDALVFTTNAESRKGREMTATGRAAVSVYWGRTGRSVNVTGAVVWADDDESDALFAAEDRGVQASRAVSFHGEPLHDETEQLRRYHALAASDQTIARPAYWRWFRIVPDAVTFWEAVPDALNRRVHYRRDGRSWDRQAVQS